MTVKVAEMAFRMRISLRAGLYALSIGVIPLGLPAQILELSQGQLRQLVDAQQVLGAKTIADAATLGFGGAVIEVRGFLSEGRVTYRLLLQLIDGSVIELLFDGSSGERVSHRSQMGLIVSSEAKSNAASNRFNNDGRNGNETSDRNSGSRDRGNSGHGRDGNGRGR